MRPAKRASTSAITCASVASCTRRGRLIEHQHARVLQQGTGNGDALALATGKLLTALAERRVQPLRQAFDQVLQSRASRRLGHRLVTGVGSGVTDVVG